MRMRCLKEKEVCDASILHKKKNEGDLYEFKRSTTNNLKLKGKDFFFFFYVQMEEMFYVKKNESLPNIMVIKKP
jgi:hypothetical protein